jgi:hypothetical protein
VSVLRTHTKQNKKNPLNASKMFSKRENVDYFCQYFFNDCEVVLIFLAVNNKINKKNPALKDTYFEILEGFTNS